MSEKTLLQKITAGQTQLEQPKFDQKVDFTAKGRRVKYNYASLSECMRVACEALNPQGVAVWHDILESDGKLYAVTCLSDENDTITRCPFPIHLNGSSQDNGSEFTYAKRYSLCAALGIVADEDDDGKAAQDAQEQRVNRSQVPAQVKKNEQPKQANGRNDALTEFIHVLTIWCDEYNMNMNEQKERIKSRDDYADTEQFYRKVTEEYRAEI